jgi:uncharacterized protein YjbJ (UPF0337 family)
VKQLGKIQTKYGIDRDRALHEARRWKREARG